MVSIKQYVLIMSMLFTQQLHTTQKSYAKGKENPLLLRAQSYLDSAQHKDAFRGLTQIITQGGDPWAVAQAHYELGNLYADGNGTTKDMQRAKQLWLLAAQQRVNPEAHMLAEKKLFALDVQRVSLSPAPRSPAPRKKSPEQLQRKPSPIEQPAEGRGENNPHLLQAQEYLASHKYDKARKVLEEIMNTSDDAWAVAEAHYRLGELNFFARGGEKNVAAAKQHWKFAATRSINPLARAWSSANLGDLYLEQGDISQARDFFNLVLKIDIDDEEVRDWAQKQIAHIDALQSRVPSSQAATSEGLCLRNVSHESETPEEQAAEHRRKKKRPFPTEQAQPKKQATESEGIKLKGVEFGTQSKPELSEEERNLAEQLLKLTPPQEDEDDDPLGWHD